MPGHPGVQNTEQLRHNILEVTLDHVIEKLTAPPDSVLAEKPEPGPRDVVFSGGFDAVNRFFYENELSDGLPIVPPTRDKVEAFLSFTERTPDEILGTVLPDSRAASVWSIAVNGVMAGCRPEYMPILVALIEAMVDPKYGVEHSGNTPGSETLIILNGPIIKELGFNYLQGALRDGFLPNTSIGRFWRLYLRNVAGFLPHKTDKATHGNTWRVVLAENEAVLKEIGWEPNSVEMGFSAGDNTVTIARYSGSSAVSSVSGTPEEILAYLTDAILRQTSWQLVFAVAQALGMLRPLLVLSPILAQTIAKGGWSKQDVKRYLFEHARLPAWEYERFLRDWNMRPIWNLTEQVRLGRIPKLFHESDDPNRMVPIVWKPEDFMIAVTGDPMRNNAFAFGHNGMMGYTVGRKIQLPNDWEQRLGEARSR